MKLFFKLIYPVISISLLWLFIIDDRVIGLFMTPFILGLLIIFSSFIYIGMDNSRKQPFRTLVYLGCTILFGIPVLVIVYNGFFIFSHYLGDKSGLGWLCLLSTLLTISLWVLLSICVRSKTICGYIPFVRISFYLFALLTNILALVLVLIVCVNLIICDYEGYNLWKYHMDPVTIGTLTLTFFLLPLCILLYYTYNGFSFLVLGEKEYVLYLRSFEFDSNDKVLNNVTSTFNIPIVKIGNPQTLFPVGVAKSFYLPTNNWKYHLNYYISKATLVFTVIDSTDGLLWEVFQHEEYMGKYVYYILSKGKLISMLERTCTKERASVLYKALNGLSTKEEIEGCYCRFIGNRLYYGKEDELLQLSIVPTSLSKIKSIPIEKTLEYEQTKDIQKNYTLIYLLDFLSIKRKEYWNEIFSRFCHVTAVLFRIINITIRLFALLIVPIGVYQCLEQTELIDKTLYVLIIIMCIKYGLGIFKVKWNHILRKPYSNEY